VNNTSDIYTKLKNDHEAVAHVLQQLMEMATGPANTAKRQTLFAELKQSLTQHSKAEEEVFYAPLRERSETRDLIRDGQNEHQRIETLLNDLDRLEKDDALWGAQLHTLNGVIEHHVHEEEEKVFPKARKIFTAQRAQELVRQFDQAKARHASTAAKSPAANNTAAVGATVRETGQRVAQEAQRLTEAAKEQGSSMRETGQRVAQEAQRLTEAAKEKGNSIFHDQQQFFASQLGGVAAALHKTAQQLGEEEQGGIAQYVDQAAAGLERFSHGLQEQDLGSLLHQVEDFARRQPVAFIGSAAFLGFLAARFLKSSGERRHPSSGPASPAKGGSTGPYTDNMAPSPGYGSTVTTPGSVSHKTSPVHGATVGTPEHEGRGTTQSYGDN
jgi:hemerythrin superfamily protein